jgi:hypothetical protein
MRITPPPDLAAPSDATILLALVVVLTPFGWLDVMRLVDVERTPHPSATCRLSTASSNTLNPPLIRPHPPLHHTLLKVQAPPPKWDGILLVYGLEKKNRMGCAGDLGAGSVQIFHFFQKAL